MLNMSARNFQRRLKLKGVTFKELLEQTRKDLAEKYIKSSTYSINEIALNPVLFLLFLHTRKYFRSIFTP